MKDYESAKKKTLPVEQVHQKRKVHRKRAACKHEEWSSNGQCNECGIDRAKAILWAGYRKQRRKG